MNGKQEEGFERFSFTGNGGEYFRIWIVNLLLTLCTLGIYSAWAKVRREQYFHRNTLLKGSGFDYHGDPRAILKGRLGAFGLFMLLGVVQKFSPDLYLVLVLALMPIVPWMIQRSLRFRAANTSYRGLRFRHRGTYREALVAYVGHGLLTLVTLSLWMPIWLRAVKRFQLGRLSYGSADFACEPAAGEFYGAYFKAGLIIAGPVVAVGIWAGMSLSGGGGGAAMAKGILFLVLVPIVLGLTFSLLARPYLQVRIANVTWNATTLEGRKFLSTQALGSYWKLHAANVLLTLITLGLYWPWAKVREAAYRGAHTSMDASDLDSLIARSEVQSSALGEEVTDVFDLDVAL